MTLKQKTVDGLFWSFIENILSQGVTFIIGIVLARLLGPNEFGLIGIISIFIAISSTFINSGFGTALIKKHNCTEKDYSTVFFFNLIMGLLFYLILIILALPISRFFNNPSLVPIIQILGVVLIIDSASIIQRTILTIRIDFKLQTKISIISSIISGIIAIYFAYDGFGVWSLVIKQICQQLITTILLFTWNKWTPKFVFSFSSFVELFSFGYKLLISSLIDTIYRNIYYTIIGKYFSTEELGFYARADQFQSLPSSNLQNIIGRVSFPVLSSIQNETSRLNNAYRKLTKSTMLITFILMLGLASISRSLIITLIGEKWEPSIIYLQLLCFVGMFYPLHALNLNVLQVKGRSDLFLKLEIIKKLLAIPIIIAGIIWGIKVMIIGMIVNSVIAFYINSYWSGDLINYSIKEQIKDIGPSFLLAIVICSIVYSIELIIPISPIVTLLFQITVGTFLFISICEIVKVKDYIYIKTIAIEKIQSLKNL